MIKKLLLTAISVVCLSACQSPRPAETPTDRGDFYPNTAPVDLSLCDVSTTKGCFYDIDRIGRIDCEVSNVDGCINLAKTGRFLRLDNTTVQSWHLGKNAQGQPYLLVIPKNNALKEMLPDDGEFDDLFLLLGKEEFDSSTPVQSGFLILNPLPKNWDKKKITQIMNAKRKHCVEKETGNGGFTTCSP